jgi:hypothetical protein
MCLNFDKYIDESDGGSDIKANQKDLSSKGKGEGVRDTDRDDEQDKKMINQLLFLAAWKCNIRSSELILNRLFAQNTGKKSKAGAHSRMFSLLEMGLKERYITLCIISSVIV